MSSTLSRQQIILRSNDMRSDDFGALFAKMFGNRYSDTPPLPSNIIIGGVYGRHEGVSFRRMHYRGDFSVVFPDPQDEITFVIPTAGKIIFNHLCESVGVSQVGLAIDKADIRSMRFVDNHAQHGISIKRALLTERLSRLLGKPIIERLVFEPVVDLKLSKGGLNLPATSTGWLALATLVVLYGTAFIVLFISVPRLDMPRNAPVMNIEPLATLLMGWIVLDQMLSAGQGSGRGDCGHRHRFADVSKMSYQGWRQSCGMRMSR